MTLFERSSNSLSARAIRSHCCYTALKPVGRLRLGRPTSIGFGPHLPPLRKQEGPDQPCLGRYLRSVQGRFDEQTVERTALSNFSKEKDYGHFKISDLER
jgi:hypothetical protein